MESFEFDEIKSRANGRKHGIDFVDAQKLWLDDQVIEIQGRTRGEARSLLIGMIEDRMWTAVVTYRGEAVRIISVRRSRVEEIERYEAS